MRKSCISSGTALFFITILIMLSGSMSCADIQPQSHVSEYVFFPNKRCTTIVYTDSINCGSSKNTLIENSQSAIISKLQLSRSGILDEPFAGIEILFKDTNETYDISAFDSIDLDMVIVNGDTFGFNVMVQQKSQLLKPFNLPPVDTFKCGDPLKRSNRRHPYSVEHMQLGVEKYRFRYSLHINSFITPTWYGEGATLYREQFDKKRFYSLSIQTGSNVPQGTEYSVIISRIAFRKSTPVIQGSISSFQLNGVSYFLIIMLSMLSLVLLIIIITFMIKQKKKTSFCKEVSPEQEKEIVNYIHANLGNTALDENGIAMHIGTTPEMVDRALRLTQNLSTAGYVHFQRLQREAQYLFERNHRHQIEWEIENNREYSAKSDLSGDDDNHQSKKSVSDPIEYDEPARKVIQYFRDNYRDLKLDDEKSDDEKRSEDTVVDSKIAKVVAMPADDIKKILDTCFGVSNKKYPMCHHFKILRIEVAKKIMKFYIENAKETYALKWLYNKVGFKEQDRLTKAWKETLNIIDETPNKFQERLQKHIM